MDDSNSEAGADPAQLRRTLKRNKTRMERQSDKLATMLADIAPEQLDLQELVDAQSLIHSLSTAYEESYCSLQEAEADSAQGEADETEFELYDRAVTLAKKQCNMLLTLKRVHSALHSLDISITSLDSGMKEPGRDHSTITKDLVLDHKDLKRVLVTSNLDPGHPLRAQCADMIDKAADLRPSLLPKMTSPPSSWRVHTLATREHPWWFRSSVES